MKIAFYVSEFPVLSETFVIRQVAGLVRLGHDVTVLAVKRGTSELQQQMLHTHGLQNPIIEIRNGVGGKLAKLALLARFLIKSSSSISGRRQLRSALMMAMHGNAAALFDIACQARNGSLGKFDAVIAHFGTTGVRAMAMQQAGLLDGPIATVFHGFDISDRRTLEQQSHNYRRLFQQTALLLPISYLWRERLISWGAPAHKVQVLRMGVDLDRLPFPFADRPLNRPLRVLSVARLTEKKGIRYAIDAVCQAPLPIEYDIIGSGQLEAELKKLAQRAGPDKTIRFLGKQSQEAVFAALRRADVFLLPSVIAAGGDMEGIPVALMEAMASGILVIATRHSGIPELIDDRISGHLVAERDAAQIAAKLVQLTRYPEQLAPLRISARQKVAAEFDNAQLDQKLEQLCAQLAGEGVTQRVGNITKREFAHQETE